MLQEIAEVIKAYLTKLFSSNQEVSWTRVIGFLIIADIMTVWTVACIVTKQYVSIPWSDASIIIAALTGKVIQSSFGEYHNTGTM